jgi:repressor LexA
VRRQSTARSGEIVVALIGDGPMAEATVKRLRLRGRRVELHPENPEFEPIVPNPDDPATGAVTLLGKVIELRRSFG